MVVCTYSLFSRLEWHTPLTSTLVMEVRLPRMLLALFAHGAHNSVTNVSNYLEQPPCR